MDRQTPVQTSFADGKDDKSTFLISLRKVDLLYTYLAPLLLSSGVKFISPSLVVHLHGPSNELHVKQFIPLKNI